MLLFVNLSYRIVGMQNGTDILENNSAGSYRVRYIHLSYSPAIQLLDEVKIYVHIKTCVWLFIAALFIISQNWKQSKVPSTGRHRMGKHTNVHK